VAELSDSEVREPIAIIGIGCRFPGGVNSPEEFWNLLCSGTDATREVPAVRWDTRKFYDPDPGKLGKMATFRGGYLEQVDQFDAQFFGISPREAAWLDPQQRLLLQVTWEALEDAGQVADRFTGSDTAVFVGGFALDYNLLQNYGVFSRYELRSHSATGMMMTMLAARISYTFDFRGPSMSVDTACSGSLVAAHLAAQSIWNGECSLALAGGVNVMLAPTLAIAEAKAGMLAPDGRCKAFDAAADGYARGEGAAVVLMKPLARALADRDPVYGVIRGSAVIQDGRTEGITVPSQDAQEQTMRLAYRRAGVAPHEVQYVEAHGTGTPVGDPIEARAIASVLSGDRPEGQHCLIGSVKTNIGHLEAGAGIAGLIKAALALKHGQIPPHLHFRDPNPGIPFDDLRLRIPTSLTEWPATEGTRTAGVNSFGFGGTNVHVVLQEAPPSQAAGHGAGPGPEDPNEAVRPRLLPISARDNGALIDQAGLYRDFLAAGRHDLGDVGYSASLRRSHHDHRLAVVASSSEQAAERLDAFVAGLPAQGVVSGHAPLSGRPKIAFICSGMGPQWWAMGRDLLASQPAFREEIERCDAALRPYSGWSLMEAICESEDRSRMEETEVAQPANFAIQLGLARLWRSWGIEPDALIGHSQGEAAAQYLSGVLSFDDAVRVTYYRAVLQQRATGQGRMLAVSLSPETLNQAAADAGPGVSVAAINSPNAGTLSGDAAILEEMARHLETFGVFNRFLRVKVPYHSHYMDPLRDELLARLDGLRPQSAAIPFYSAVTGTRIDGSGVDAEYWWHNVRSTVLFAAAFSQLVDDGCTVFVELSPHPVLAGSITELLAHLGREGVVVPSLRRREPDHEVLLGSLGTLYTRGCPVAWDALYGTERDFLRLPGYPWQLKTYWAESPEAREDLHYREVHPLLGQRIDAAHPTWELELDRRRLPFLADHRIQHNVVFPGAGFIELALAAAVDGAGAGDYDIENLAFRNALVLTDACDPRLRTVLDPGQGTVEISSYNPGADGNARWTVHATARLRLRQAAGGRLDLDAPPLDHAAYVPREEFYEKTRQMGFEYGPAFQTLEGVETRDGRAAGLVRVPAVLADEADGYLFHPTLIDGALQVLLVAAATTATEPYLPVSIERVRVFARPVEQMHVAAEIVEADDQHIVSNLRMLNPDGDVLVEIEGFRARSLETSAGLSPQRIDRGLYELTWQATPRTEAAPTEDDTGADDNHGTWLVFADQGGVADALTRQIAERGRWAVTVSHGNVPRLVEESGHYVLNPDDGEQFQQLTEALAEHGPISRVVHLWSLDSALTDAAPLTALEQDQTLGALSVLRLTQALSRSGWARPPAMWLITRRAQAVDDSPGTVSVEQAPVWGLGRVIGHAEFTNMWGGLVDIDAGSAEQQAALLADEIIHTDGEDQVAFRDGERYVARLTRSTRLTSALPPAIRRGGSYLVTGGLGGLGLAVARFLVTQGANHLILMSRSKLPERSAWRQLPPDDPKRNLVDQLMELERLGATIHLATVDVGSEEQLASWLADYSGAGYPPIRGVVHAAGVVEDELLARMSTESFHRVLRPTLRGGWLLHQMLKGQQLDFFALFSSAGSIFASSGQANYAAANTFLDALAYHRRSLGLPAIAIGWGPWSTGMVEQRNLEQYYTRRGIDLITAEAGVQILARVLEQRPAQLTAISVDWERARETWPTGTMPPMFGLLSAIEGQQADGDEQDEDGDLLTRLGETPETERTAIVSSYLHQTVARALQLDPSAFNEQESLIDLGMDSIMAVEVRTRIEAALKVDVTVLDLLQDSTIAGLADLVLGSLTFDQAEQYAAPEDAPAQPVPVEPVPAEPDSAEAALPEDELEQLIGQLPSSEIERILSELEQDIR
jgi:acyl transferase domain-containing protein/aryl carrier-like protein